MFESRPRLKFRLFNLRNFGELTTLIWVYIILNSVGKNFIPMCAGDFYDFIGAYLSDLIV